MSGSEAEKLKDTNFRWVIFMLGKDIVLEPIIDTSFSPTVFDDPLMGSAE